MGANNILITPMSHILCEETLMRGIRKKLKKMLLRFFIFAGSWGGDRSVLPSITLISLTSTTPIPSHLITDSANFIFRARPNWEESSKTADPYRVFSLTWPESMQIYWNKRKRLHKKRVQLPLDWFGTQTWWPFHCFGTQIWLPWRHVKAHNTDARVLKNKGVRCMKSEWKKEGKKDEMNEWMNHLSIHARTHSFT